MFWCPQGCFSRLHSQTLFVFFSKPKSPQLEQRFSFIFKALPSRAHCLLWCLAAVVAAGVPQALRPSWNWGASINPLKIERGLWKWSRLWNASASLGFGEPFPSLLACSRVPKTKKIDDNFTGFRAAIAARHIEFYRMAPTFDTHPTDPSPKFFAIFFLFLHPKVKTLQGSRMNIFFASSLDSCWTSWLPVMLRFFFESDTCLLGGSTNMKCTSITYDNCVLFFGTACSAACT